MFINGIQFAQICSVEFLFCHFCSVITAMASTQGTLTAAAHLEIG